MKNLFVKFNTKIFQLDEEGQTYLTYHTTNQEQLANSEQNIIHFMTAPQENNMTKYEKYHEKKSRKNYTRTKMTLV